MQGAFTALNSSIIGAMRSLFAAMSSSTSVPENQPPQSVTSAASRIGSMTSGSSGKRRPYFHAGEAGRARLAQAFLERDVVAEFGKIVVPPRDGRHARVWLSSTPPLPVASSPMALPTAWTTS